MSSMTGNTSKLQVTSLDFDTIKTNLITFMQSQSQFADYDFTGSALNTLIDLLTYNTVYNALYLNLVANEMFLDTAVLRQTVVSHAKALGYTPASAVSSQAVINVSIQRANTDNTSILTMPRFTQFSSVALDGTAYNFVSLDSATTAVTGNTFIFTNIAVNEGSPTTKIFIQNSNTNPTQTFNLVDQNVDSTSVQVIVQNSQTNTTKSVYTLSTDATITDGSSQVYFLEEGTAGNYVIYFGDGIIGRALTDGNIVVVSYIITNANNANGLDSFTLQNPLLAGSVTTITTVSPSNGGTPIEDVASIKFAAPKAYTSQNRAVTVNDYMALINKNYPYFDAVTVWGGETVKPPVYGKVFWSAKPQNGYGITIQQQQFINSQIIAPISVLTVEPVYVPVDYNFLNLTIYVDYDSTQTTNSPQQLTNIVEGAIENYANLNLNTFNSEFRLSRLLRAVDDSENSILSSTATIYIEKRIIPNLTSPQSYVVNTGIQIQQGTTNFHVYSSPTFTVNDSGGIPRQAYIEETPNSYSGLDNIEVITPGQGYLTSPRLIINGDGVGANAYSVIVNGQVKNVVIDNPGSEYTTATVTVNSANGSGASFLAVLQGQYGVLRTYYFDQNNNKVIINANAGTIDYINGIITLDNFNPTAINSPYGTLSIFVPPETLTFGSSRQIILTLDPTEMGARPSTSTISSPRPAQPHRNRREPGRTPPPPTNTPN